jgi:glycine cleavage system H protein
MNSILGGMENKMMKYSKSHEWVLVKDGIARVGLTQYGLKELGEIVYVELPEVNKVFHPGDEVVVLESTKAAADFSTPLAGKVVKVNPLLQEKTDLLNSSPEGDGWLFEIELTSSEGSTSLLSEEGYRSLTSKKF